MTERDIAIVKEHIFNDKHILYDDVISRFPPDYDMAVAWKRLADGDPEERDIVLMKHELLESQLEKANNWPIDKAHAEANKKYPWEKELYDELGEDGEEDGLL